VSKFEVTPEAWLAESAMARSMSSWEVSVGMDVLDQVRSPKHGLIPGL